MVIAFVPTCELCPDTGIAIVTVTSFWHWVFPIIRTSAEMTVLCGDFRYAFKVGDAVFGGRGFGLSAARHSLPRSVTCNEYARELVEKKSGALIPERVRSSRRPEPIKAPTLRL